MTYHQHNVSKHLFDDFKDISRVYVIMQNVFFSEGRSSTLTGQIVHCSGRIVGGTYRQEDASSIIRSITSLYLKYADIFEKQTPKLLPWKIYISIYFMVTKPFTSCTTGRPKRHLKPNREPNKMATRDVFAKQTVKPLNFYVKLDMGTNIPVNVQYRYASHVASRYKTDHRLVCMENVPIYVQTMSSLHPPPPSHSHRHANKHVGPLHIYIWISV